MSRADRTRSREGNAGVHHACEECSRNCQLVHVRKTDLTCSVSRFFKILVGDWSEALFLPPAFEPVVADKLGQRFELENALGQKWTVTLSSQGDRYAFKKGWEDFVVDNDLNGGDLLIFNYMKGIKGPDFVVHVFGRTGREKICQGVQGNASAQVKQRVRINKEAIERSMQSPSDVPGLKSKPSAPESSAQPCTPGSLSKHSAPGPSSKSKLSSVPRGIYKPSSALRAQDYGGDGEMSNSMYSKSNHEVHRRHDYGNKEVLDGGIGRSNPHTGIRLQAEDKVNYIRTEMAEKDHAGMRSPAEANKEVTNGAKNMKSDTTVYSVSMRTRIKDRIKTMKSNLHTVVTDVAEKDPASLRSLAEGNKDHMSDNMTNEDKFSARDCITRKCEKGNSAKLSDDFCEELGQKGNVQNSVGAKNNGAVFPKSDLKPTGYYQKIVEKEQQERSEPGLNDAKRKRDFESEPEGSSEFKLVKTEPYEDTSADQGTVTCLAITDGELLELPDKLPALRSMTKKSKPIFLMDQQRSLWPALYEERSGLPVLFCHWDKFNPRNGIQDGDSYSFTVENASLFIYRVAVIHPM